MKKKAVKNKEILSWDKVLSRQMQKYRVRILPLTCLALLAATFPCADAATPMKPPVNNAPAFPKKPSPMNGPNLAGSAIKPVNAPVSQVTSVIPVTPVSPKIPSPRNGISITTNANVKPVNPISPVTPVTPVSPKIPSPRNGISITTNANVKPVKPISPVTPVTPKIPVAPVAPKVTLKPVNGNEAANNDKPSKTPSRKPSKKPSKTPSRKPSAAPSNKPSGTYWWRAASAPICSSTSETTYLALEACSNITYSEINKQIEVAFCDTNAIAGIRIYEYNESASLSYNLYGFVGVVWTFLVSGNANAAVSFSPAGLNYFEVKFPSASYPKFRLTLSSFQGFELSSVKFLQSYSTNCEKSYKFRTKAALQLAIQEYTANEATKKLMIDKFGVMICWNVALITDMSDLFNNKTLFDEDISCWDCSNVRNMSRMFYNAQSFKGDLGRWNLSNVEDISEMFFGATSFASSVVTWNISKVKSTRSLFYNASSFNQDLCPWYNLIDTSVVTDDMFSLSGCNDRSDPNMTSKTSFCQECSCCGGSCFNPVGNCEDGYVCNASTSTCVKPVEPDYCRLKTRESYGCQDFYECHQLLNYTTPSCTKPFLGSVCNQGIGCFDGLVCSNGICVLPKLYEYCNSTNYGCSPGFTCDSLTVSCRIPYLNESCLPPNGTSFGCDSGHLCKNSVCAMPTLNDVCDEIVGCVSGYSCDHFTNLCRKPKEAEFCLSQDVLTFGCQDGLQCTNVNLLARANSTTGNILAKFYNLPPNTTVLPYFDPLTWYFVTYAESIAYVGNGVKNLGAVYEGNLRFPVNGTWIIYVTSNSSYNLLANNVSMVTSNGNVNETSNPIYIPMSNQTNKIRLEFLDILGNSSIKLQWLSPGVNQTRADIPSSLWDLDEYSCSKPLGENYGNQTSRRALTSGTTRNLIAACGECQENFGCLNGLYCVNTCCVKPDVTQQCITQIGCLPGLTCDANFTVCRKPVVNETCEDAVGCQEGLYCKNKICLKPALNESCLDSVGCFDDGAVCRSSNTSVVCEKPTSGESCSLSLGCSVGYVCDQTLTTCRLPQLSETCFNNLNCTDGYSCHNHTCYLPTDNEPCVSSIGCRTGNLCKDYGTGISLCQKPLLGERCDFDVQCGDSALLCEWAGLNPNYCRYKKFAGEDCRTDDDCLDQAVCSVNPNVEISIYDCPRPSSAPSLNPSRTPSKKPSKKPSRKPSKKPSRKPSKKPSKRPSRKPSKKKPVAPNARRRLSTPTSLPLLLSGFCSGSISLVKSIIASNINYSSATSDCFGSGRDSDVLANITGYLQFPQSGTWTLYIQSDGEVVLNMNGSTLIANEGGWEESSATVEIAYSGQTKPFTVEAIQASGGCRLRMSWSRGTQSKYVIPLNAFVSGKPENPNPSICLNRLPYAVQPTCPLHISVTYYNCPTGSLSCIGGTYIGHTYVSEINYPSTVSNCFGSSKSEIVRAAFSGYIKFPHSGSWTLYLTSDDGSTLYIGNSLIIDNGGLHGMEEVSGTITTTTANEIKAFTANVFEIGGACGIILMWSHPSLQVKQVIPASAFVSTPNTNPNSPICYDVVTKETTGAAALNYSTTMISYGSLQDFVGGGGFSLTAVKPKPPVSDPNPFHLPVCCEPYDRLKALNYLYKTDDCVEYASKNYICYTYWGDYNYCNYFEPWSYYWWAAWQNPPTPCYLAPPTPGDSNSSINLHGNTWKAFKLSQPYNVTKFTVLLFGFHLTTEAEGHAICVDEDGDYDTFSGLRRRCVAIAGTQKDQWDNDLILSGESFRVVGTENYAVPLGNLFDTSVLNIINYIALIQDNDSNPLKGESSFQNITLREDPSLSQANNIFSAVTLCELQDFKGKCYGLGVGRYDWAPTYGIPNDWVSSIKVLHGYNVTVFFGSGFSGRSTTFTANNATMGDFAKQLSSLIVTTTSANTFCSCQDSGTIDYTGRPLNLSATQDNGYVRFNFTDNSLCEEAFSFTRSLVSEEFVTNVSEKGSSFTSDYYANSKSPCGGIVAPGTEAADDLRTSTLPVGQIVTYCVRAVAQSYMDYPGFERSSDDTCTTHKVLWEASISGKVTTKPNAGRAPIQDVIVKWYVLDPSQKSVVLTSGTYLSTNGGSFDIVIKSADVISKGVITNDVLFPVKVTFFKQLGNVTGDNHAFLCNDGQVDCSQDGTVVYLKHLQFNEPLYVYDNSAVLFTGTLSVQGTSCPIVDAEVCLYEKSTTGVNATLVCGKTDAEGFYSVGVVIGSTVHSVGIAYHGHIFMLASTNPYIYDAGVPVEAGNTYSNHDFVDTTTGSLTVEIVGGKCDRRLGSSTIQVQIVGCPSSAKRYHQGGPIQKHVLPAHMLSVQVLDIKDDSGVRRLQMFEFFQGSSPQERLFNLTNVTAQASAGFDSSVIPGNDAQASKVRFQYDGELQIKFSIERSKERMDQTGSCPQAVTNEYSLTGDSVHVIETFKIFRFRVDLLFQIIPEEGVTCDMADDSVKLRIFSQVGANRITDKLFLDGISDNITKEALLHCSEGCLVNITNDTSGHNAGVDYSLVTGQPNIIAPYTKELFLQVIGVPGEVTYTASIIVTGPYSKGPGQSFALPTHYPVMILRDPPGGLSYASYQNVVTKFSMKSNGGSGAIYVGVEASLHNEVEQQVDTCFGGGFGVIVMMCKPKLLAVRTHFGFDATAKTGLLFSGSDQTSDEISTTWSFETSQDPWLAGKMSDVFVVPNLNVLYQIVTQVSWNASSCSITTKDEVKFNLNAPENKPAIAFYSRWHILNVKQPELKHALKVETDEKKRKTLQEGYDGWDAALNKESETAKIKTRLSDLFTIDELKSQASLVSPSLQDRAESLSNSLTKSPIKDINRLQFSGGGNTYTLTMSQNKVADHVFSVDYTILEAEAKLGGDVSGTVFGVGFEGTVKATLSVDTHYIYSEQTTNTNSTEVSFVLGDSDVGDEFVVELFRDNRYGSFVFETIAGQSSCPNEDKTAKNLDPRIVLTSLPSPVVMPDEAILFEVELANLGVGSGNFVLLADDNSNYEELGLSYYNSPISISSNERVTKLVQVNIGPRLFQYKPVDLFLREACFDGVYQQRDSFSQPPHVTLQNVQDEKGSFLEFVKPCPEVEWAGEFKRDQSFLVNKQSDNVNELQILIRNPDFSSEKFQDKERLESIFLWYRRVGDAVWSKALGEVSDGGAIQTKELDLYKYGTEDNYGFITNLKWLLRGVVIEGTYEIKVECECFAAGGPKDYDISSTTSLIGVYDVTAPKLYGSPLPLDDVVLVGEEMTFVFTEPLQCSKPYSFDIQMRLYGSSTREIDLQVICEGNHVSLQVDQDKYNVAQLMGKKFVVEIGSIGTESSAALTDKNGNPLEFNVKFSKTFANLDLSQASTSFEFVLDNVTCTDSTVGALQDEIRESIRVSLGMSSIDRIQIIDLNCVDNKNKVAATVLIAPPSSAARRFLSSNNKEDDNSVNLFYALQDASAKKKSISRMLSTGAHDSTSNHFIVRGIKITPGLADLELLTKNATVLQTEKKIRDFEKTFHLNPINSNGMNDLAINLLKEVKSEIQDEQLSLQSLLKHEHELDAEMREMKATYEAEMLEHEHVHEAELKKMHDEEVRMHEMDSMEMKTMFLEMKIVLGATISLAVVLLFLLKR